LLRIILHQYFKHRSRARIDKGNLPSSPKKKTFTVCLRTPN